jgi:hypothetical protein
MPEKAPTPELFDEMEQALIERLKDPGVDDSETIGMFDEWAKREEKKADRAGVSRANIEVNLKKAKLFMAAGEDVYAYSYLGDVRLQAHQEGEADLFAEAKRLMGEIENP